MVTKSTPYDKNTLIHWHGRWECPIHCGQLSQNFYIWQQWYFIHRAFNGLPNKAEISTPKKKIWNDIPKWEPFTLKINWCFDCLVNSKNDKKIKQKTKYKIQFAWTHMHGTLKFCTPLLYSISPSHKNQFGPAFSVEYMYVYVYIYIYIYVIKKVSLSLSLYRKLKINSVCLSRLFRVLLHGTVTYCLAAHSGSLFLSVYHSLFVSLRKIPKWSGATLQLHILLKSSSGYSYFSYFFFISIFVCPYNSNPFCFTFHFLVKDCVETNYGFWFWSWLGCWENVSFFTLNTYVGVTFFLFLVYTK